MALKTLNEEGNESFNDELTNHEITFIAKQFKKFIKKKNFKNRDKGKKFRKFEPQNKDNKDKPEANKEKVVPVLVQCFMRQVFMH